MGLIYYKGEEYTEMPPILANAITLTEEEAERYNISLVDADVQEVTLDTGERLFLGAPGSNFICQGFNIVQATTDEEFLAKIKPEDAYTYFVPTSAMKVRTENGWFVDYGSYSTSLSISGGNFTITAEASHGIGSGRPRRLTITGNTSDLYAYGLVFRAIDLTDQGLYANGYLVAWTKQDEDYAILTYTDYSVDFSADTFQFNGWRENEYDYACGITGKFSYVTKEEWDEIVAGQGG